MIGTVSITEVSGENKRTHIFRHLKRSKKPLGIKFAQLKVEFFIYETRLTQVILREQQWILILTLVALYFINHVKALGLNKLNWYVKRFDKRLCNFKLTDTVKIYSNQSQKQYSLLFPQDYLGQSRFIHKIKNSTLSWVNFIPEGFLLLFRCRKVCVRLFSPLTSVIETVPINRLIRFRSKCKALQRSIHS